MTNVGFSYRNESDYTVFDNETIQNIWKENSVSNEEGDGPLPHLHMVVDIVESSSHKKYLRLLTIYDSKEKKYIEDEEKNETFAFLSGILYNVDRNGDYMKSDNYCFESDNDDYPNMQRDSEGFYSGKCRCGGTVMPMYDEQPFWIAFCNKCDRRWENSESSPLPY